MTEERQGGCRHNILEKCNDRETGRLDEHR